MDSIVDFEIDSNVADAVVVVAVDTDDAAAAAAVGAVVVSDNFDSTREPTLRARCVVVEF